MTTMIKYIWIRFARAHVAAYIAFACTRVCHEETYAHVARNKYMVQATDRRVQGAFTTTTLYDLQVEL